jgi:hypothetical protein
MTVCTYAVAAPTFGQQLAVTRPSDLQARHDHVKKEQKKTALAARAGA